MNICVVAHFAYGAMTGGNSGHVGGVERQTSLICRRLAAHGHRVNLLVWDEGQKDEVKIDGVRVIKMCRHDAGLFGLRFFHPRWTSLNRAMQMADAELYYQNCAEYVTGQVALWCKINKRRFVYSVASDPECDPGLPNMHTFREKVLYRYGLRRADRIIVQTHNQQQMLLIGFGLESVVFPMPCPCPVDGQSYAPHAPDKGNCRVLWAGRISRVKRVEFLLDIAAALPGVMFDIAGAPDAENVYSKSVLSRAHALPNITVHGQVPRDRMPELYRNASLLCCTSSYEGFPNTFLEAWSCGLPVVSTIDPDNLIDVRRLGVVATDTAALVSAISNLTQSPDNWSEMSKNARQYYLENHAIEPSIARFEELFMEVLDSGINRVES